MKFILFCLLTFIHYHFYAQSKWKIGVNASPDLCYRTLKFETPDYEAEYHEFITDHPRTGFSVGAISTYSFSPNLEIESGLIYFRHALFVESSQKYYQYQAVDHVTLLTSSDYLMLPLKANFLMGNETFGFVGTVGLSAAQGGFNSKTIQTNYDSANVEIGRYSYSDNRYSDFLLMTHLGVGAYYVMNEKFELRVLPTCRYTFNGNYAYLNHYKFRPLSVGLSCSVLLRI